MEGELLDDLNFEQRKWNYNLPSFLLFPFFAYRWRDLFDIILPLEKVPNEFDFFSTNHRVGREKGGEELSHRAVRGGYSIGVLISARSLIVALSCKEIVIYRKKWWFEDSLILSANTYIYIYILCIKESCVFKKNYCYYYDRMTGNGFHLCCRRIVSLLRTKRSVTR